MYSLRLATIDDLDLVSEIEAEAFPPAERASRERLAGRMAVFADDFLILFEDGRPVGYVAGMLCGSMANPMALNYANDTIAGDHPAVSYATVYPFCMFLRVIVAQLVVMSFL